MKKILLTGGTGFVGRNIIPVLQQEYIVDAPGRAALDVYNLRSVNEYWAKNPADILVHCAICTPACAADHDKSVLESTLRSFLNLKNKPFEKIIFIGSGAEFDKHYDIVEASEEDVLKKVPLDEYGLAKYTLNEMARSSANIYNLRLFGCYGPYEPPRRFIRHAIECCQQNKPITIRQDCRFSYVYVTDLGRAALRVLSQAPKRQDYNICSDKPYYLSELAEMVKAKMNADVPVQILSAGLNNEYTGSNACFKRDFADFKFTSIEEGIDLEIKWKLQEGN